MSSDLARLRCLAIRPAPASESGGDEVVYRKSLAFLRTLMDVEVLELQSVGKIKKLVSILAINPPETTRFISAENERLVTERLRGGEFDVALLCNEVSFPMLKAVKATGVPAVLAAHNLQSVVAASDPTWFARMLRPLAVAFERRWYGDPATELVLISQTDAVGLARAGVHRARSWIAPPGAPPAAPLSGEAQVLGEAVITGSFGWWRKRRDLKAFAAQVPLDATIYVTDPLALETLDAQAGDMGQRAWSWSDGLRFGLVIDRFVGGFKLKSLEYIANNCMIVSLSDIGIDFEGLPHANEFVRHVRDKAEMQQVIDDMRLQPHGETIGRFLEFKEACMAQYDWSRCTMPTADAIATAAGREAFSAPTEAAA